MYLGEEEREKRRKRDRETMFRATKRAYRSEGVSYAVRKERLSEGRGDRDGMTRERMSDRES